MKENHLSSATPVGTRLLSNYQIRIWSSVTLSIIVCAAISWIHYQQQQVLKYTVSALEDIREARIDMTKGFLQVSIARDPASPFSRDQGLALLQQAVSTLGRVLPEAGVLSEATSRPYPAETESLEAFQASVHQLGDKLLRWGQTTVSNPGLETELRIAFFDLERKAEQADAMILRDLNQLETRFHRTFVATLCVAALLLAGICGTVYIAGYNQRKSQVALWQSEQRFKAIASNTPDHILVQDRDLKYTFVLNPQLDLTEEDMTGKTDHDLLSGADADALTAIKRKVLETGQSVHLKVPLRPRHGEQQYFEGSYIPKRDADGRIDGLIGYFRNITERMRTEEELAAYRQHLEELVRQRTLELRRSEEKLQRSERLASIGTLAAGVAHEINNPVGGILLAAELSHVHETNPPNTVSALDTIIHHARRCKAIIENVRQFAKAQTSEKIVGDIESTVQHAVDQTREYANRSGCTLSFSARPPLPPMQFNVTAIEQVVTNLIHNAIEAGAKRVDVRTEFTADSVRLMVEDDGGGIEEDRIRYLFDPFYTTRRNKGGTGLGLSIVHGIVQDHGGAIDVVSTPQKGTVFTIAFPVTPRMGETRVRTAE